MTKQIIKLRVGLIGWSAESISQGEPGFCYFPLGIKDPTYTGGRVWVKLRVTALEDIRAERDVIVADEELNVKEHTPVELSYQTTAGPFQRVTEQFPLPVAAYFDEEGTPQRVTNGVPLPVTAGSKAITYITIIATAAGNTALVTPGAGIKVRVHYFSISNAHVALADVGMRFAAGGAIQHRYALAALGGNANANLIDANWEGADGEVLFAFLTAAYAGGVYFTIGYTLE